MLCSAADARTSTILAEIIASLRVRYAYLNRHYEAAWTDSWTHRRCEHQHNSLMEAAQCAMPHGAGWYVFAVEYGAPRQLSDAEDAIVDEFRFSHALSPAHRNA